MRRIWLALTLVGITVVIGVKFRASSLDDELFSHEKRLLEELQKTFEGGVKSGAALNMMSVGQNDIGDRGFNADVETLKGFAYVGHWGFFDPTASKQRFCPEEPESGVAVIDARDPADPIVVSKLQNPPGTSAEDVVVYTAKYGPFAGHDIAAAGIQSCGGTRFDPSFLRGLMLWDVTDPAHPVQLGFHDTGCCTRGVHEFDIQHRADLKKTFAYAMVPFSERADSTSPTGVRDRHGRGDFRLIDITDPSNPVEASSWGIVRDLGGSVTGGQGCDPLIFGHGADPSSAGKLVFLSYWDAGFIAIDVSDAARPLFRGKTVYPANVDGDGHSSSFDERRKLLFTADEDFCKTSGPDIETGFGYLRVFDYSKLGAPQQIGVFRTPNSLGTNDQGAGDYTIHNPLVVGTDVYASWYSDGVRVIDTSDPRTPREVAFFVPPAGHNPVKPSQRSVLTNTTQVWGVDVDTATGLIYASDMNTGLWVLRRTDK